MACNSNDRRQWRKQEVAVGTAVSRMRVLLKARSIRWVPQPVLVSEEEASDPLADVYPLVSTQYSPMLWPGWFVTSSLR